MILEAMQRAADLLGEYRVFMDTAEINPPGVLIQPPELHTRFRRGTADVDMTLIVIVGNNEPRKALQQLSELVAGVQTALGERAVTGRPATVFLAEQTASLRAYELTYTDSIREGSHA